MNFLSKYLLFTLFLVPILPATSLFGYEHIKVLAFIVLTTIAASIWLVSVFKKPKETSLPMTGISKTASLFILILLLTSLIGINSQASFFGIQPYFQGVLLYLYLLLFSWLVAVSKVKLEQVAYVLTTSSLIVSALAIKDWIALNFFHISVPTYAGRVVSTFGQPNFYGGFLLLTLPFTYYLFKRTSHKSSYLWLACSLLAILAVFISYSRSTIFLTLVLLILALVDQLKIKFKLAVLLGVVIVLAGSLFVASKYSSGIIEKEITKPLSIKYLDLSKDPVEKRVYIWPQVLLIGQQKLLTGYGLENISQAFSGYFQTNKHPLFEENVNIDPVLISLKDLNLDRTHNYLLDLWLFSGIFGVLSWVILVFLLLNKLRQFSSDRGKNVLMVALITYLVWIQLQNQSIVHLIYFWLLVGLIDQKAIDKQ